MYGCVRILAGFTAWCGFSLGLLGGEASLTHLQIHPAAVHLDAGNRTQSFIVTAYDEQGRTYDVTSDALLEVSDHVVAKLQGRAVRPVGDGHTELIARYRGLASAADLTVEHANRIEPISFRYEALAALSKQDCNSGACHGSPSGKGGFRLSLRAYDPAFDAHTLVQEEYGRRANPFSPDDSLLLQKPLMQVAHGGGRRLSPADPAYSVLRTWIAEGCRADPPAAVCERIEVYPARRTLVRPADRQQLCITAYFSDGATRDVTSLCTFTSSDESIASVKADGLVRFAAAGEAAVLVRFDSLAATSELTHLRPDPAFHWSSPSPRNYVDELVDAKLRLLQITPSPACSDGEFIRRIYLDVLGQLPTATEARAFLADDSAGKRERLIDELLERSEYASFWAQKWGDLLRLSPKHLGDQAPQKFHRWLVAAFRENIPYDRFASELLLATGGTLHNPAANYYRALADYQECAETTSQVFLGLRMQCAKCHNHPFERWTQDNYHGIGAFFNRVDAKPGRREGEFVVYVKRSGEVTQPRTGETMAPWLPDVGEVQPAGFDRRPALVAWLQAVDNPYFAACEVNRIWAHVMGRGVSDPVDDLRESNPPSNRPLIDALARDFIESGFDRKYILRTILRSNAYQRSFETLAGNADDDKYFSHARARLLAAEPLLDAVSQVTGVAEEFAELPALGRAIDLPAPASGNEFLKVFGQPPRETACQCERGVESNLAQALQMINGPLVHGKLTSEQNILHRWVAERWSNERIVEELFLSAYSRYPSEEETQSMSRHIAAQPDRMAGLEDVCWGLLNSKEFLFQH